MMDIVLITLPFWAHMTPGLGPGLLKSYLRENGFSCRLIDVNVHAYNIRGEKYAHKWDVSNGWELSDEKVIEYYEDNRRLFEYYQEEIERIAPEVVGFTVYYSSLSLTKLFASELKKRIPDIRIILGGPSVAVYMRNTRELLEKPYIDAICLGEGERALVYYMNEVFNGVGKPLPGVTYKRDGTVIEALPVENIKKLDSLPFPDFDDLNLSAYTGASQYPSYTSRGCPNKCFYCTERNFFDGLRVRSAQRLMEEFDYVSTKYPQIREIRFMDSISNAKIPVLEMFCDLKIRSGSRLKFNLENAVIRKEMRLPLYRKLKKAGCTVVGYGMETSSQDLLKDVGKLLAIGVDLPRVLSEGKKAGLYISVNIMFGLPGESERHFSEMVEFIKANRRSLSGINPAVNFCAFYPGSFVYENPAGYGVDLTLGPDYWSSQDGSNTYPVRMQRFETFLKEAKELKLDNLLGTDVLPNKHSMLFDYYCVVNDKENALLNYEKILPKDRTPGQVDRYRELIGQGRAEPKPSVDSYILLRVEQGWEPDYSSLSWMIANFELARIQTTNQWNDQVHPVKKFIRNLAYRIIGMDRIEKHINGIVAMMKLIPYSNGKHGVARHERRVSRHEDTGYERVLHEDQKREYPVIMHK